MGSSLASSVRRLVSVRQFEKTQLILIDGSQTVLSMPSIKIPYIQFMRTKYPSLPPVVSGNGASFSFIFPDFVTSVQSCAQRMNPVTLEIPWLHLAPPAGRGRPLAVKYLELNQINWHQMFYSRVQRMNPNGCPSLSLLCLIRLGFMVLNEMSSTASWWITMKFDTSILHHPIKSWPVLWFTIKCFQNKRLASDGLCV